MVLDAGKNKNNFKDTVEIEKCKKYWNYIIYKGGDNTILKED